jgi:hypothetical protein
MGYVKEPAIIDTMTATGQCFSAESIQLAENCKKKPKPSRLGLNPPKEEGGGDKLVGGRRAGTIGSFTTSGTAALTTELMIAQKFVQRKNFEQKNN